MQGAPIVFTGLGVVILAGVSPFLLSLASGGGGEAPDLSAVLAEAAKKGHCVESQQFMKDAHMDLLDDWRDRVVREGERSYERDGKPVLMSLTRTCLDCHGSRERFCTECHDYLGVEPSCWDCHLDIEATEAGR